MVVVYFDQYILAFLLHTDAETSREWCLKGAVNISRKELCGYRGMRQSAERSPEKEPRCFAHSSGGLGQILIRRKTGQSLYVADIDSGITWNKYVSWSNHAIEPVNPDKKTRRKWTSHIAGGDLSIG